MALPCTPRMTLPPGAHRLAEEKRVSIPVLASHSQTSGLTSPSGSAATICIGPAFGTCSGYTQSMVTGWSRVRSPATVIAFLGIVNGAGGSNFGMAGNALGLLPFVIPPSTQSVTSAICSCVSP